MGFRCNVEKVIGYDSGKTGNNSYNSALSHFIDETKEEAEPALANVIIAWVPIKKILCFQTKTIKSFLVLQEEGWSLDYEWTHISLQRWGIDIDIRRTTSDWDQRFGNNFQDSFHRRLHRPPYFDCCRRLSFFLQFRVNHFLFNWFGTFWY